MKIYQLIEILSKLPQDSKVLVNAELGWYDLTPEDVEHRLVYNIWHSRYNSPNSEFISYSSEKRDFTYKSENKNVEDYVCKTIGEEFVVLLG